MQRYHCGVHGCWRVWPGFGVEPENLSDQQLHKLRCDAEEHNSVLPTRLLLLQLQTGFFFKSILPVMLHCHKMQKLIKHFNLWYYILYYFYWYFLCCVGNWYGFVYFPLFYLHLNILYDIIRNTLLLYSYIWFYFMFSKLSYKIYIFSFKCIRLHCIVKFYLKYDGS